MASVFKGQKFDSVIILLIIIFCAGLAAFGISVAGIFAGTPLFWIAAAGVLLCISAAGIALIIRIKESAIISKSIASPLLDGITGTLENLSLSLSDVSRGDLTVQPEVLVPAKKKQVLPNSTIFARYHSLLQEHIFDAITNFHFITAAPCRRFCYIGADSIREGELCGKAMAEIINSSDEVIVFINNFDVVSASVRMKSFEKFLKDNAPKVRIAEIIEEHENPDIAYRKTLECLKKYPDLKGIYVTDGTVPAAAARAVREENKSVAIVCHDLTDETMEYVKRGVIKATLSQSPYLQGFNPAMYLYNFLVTKEQIPINRILTKIELVTPENYKEYWDENKGMLLSETARQAMAKPMENKHHESIRIAVILPSDEKFWKAVADGAKQAEAILSGCNTEVRLVIPEKIRRGDWSLDSFQHAIRECIDQGFQAIALPVYLKELIPFINEGVDNGVVFATLNSEPFSFRSLILSITDHTRQLFIESEILSNSAAESAQLTSHISETMNQILTANETQIGILKKTDRAVDSLLENISRVTQDTGEIIHAAGDTSRAATAGNDTVLQSVRGMESLKSISEKTTTAIENLAGQALKIREIIHLVEEITEKTKMLSLNAAIEAAHAGIQGKGFAVVANEIRVLAEKSGQANTDIKGLIETVLESVDEATVSVKQSILEVNKNYGLSEKVKSSFDNIMEASLVNEKKSTVMMELTRSMTGLSEDLKKSMNELVLANNRNNIAITEITLSSREIRDQVEEISSAARILTQMAQAEEDLIRQLTI
ncbi:MAG: substrate-binding domain-containing protein [Spirochaetales bacterium]|nr:substrate-binding domain-containing protein [Spirochaetales bacterium]